MQNHEQRTWPQSVICQFHLTMTGKIHPPIWFALLFAGGILAAQNALYWKAVGVLLVIAALPTMVQETRRAHGSNLPFFGWWKLFQYFMQGAAAVVLIVSGAVRGYQNIEFAVGVIAVVITTAWAIFRYVLNKQ